MGKENLNLAIMILQSECRKHAVCGECPLANGHCGKSIPSWESMEESNGENKENS